MGRYHASPNSGSGFEDAPKTVGKAVALLLFVTISCAFHRTRLLLSRHQPTANGCDHQSVGKSLVRAVWRCDDSVAAAGEAVALATMGAAAAMTHADQAIGTTPFGVFVFVGGCFVVTC